MRIVVIHSVNGATKTVEFHAPHLSSQLHRAGISVALKDSTGGETGFALFSNTGLVALTGTAADQYHGVRPPIEERRDA